MPPPIQPPTSELIALEHLRSHFLQNKENHHPVKNRPLQTKIEGIIGTRDLEGICKNVSTCNKKQNKPLQVQ